MADTFCAPHAPPSAPSLATMAVATGAAIFAGAVLSRKGLSGIAAGVAVIAGAKWLSNTRGAERPAPQDTISTTQDLSPEVHPPEPDCLDWVDHDAVDFGHVVPDSTQAAEMLKEKTLPLLDDDGQPVNDVIVLPDFPKLPQPEPPLGPIIWKPGRFPQSRSDGTGETVWYGVQDNSQSAQAPVIPVIALLSPAPAQKEALSPVEVPPAPQIASTAPADLPVSGHPEPVAPPVQGPAPHGENPFLSAPGEVHHDEPVPGSLPAGSTVSFMPSAAASHPAVIAAKPAGKSFLPQPRRPGELPKSLPGRHPRDDQESPEESPHSDPSHAEPTELPTAQSVLQPERVTSPHRHLEPMAPVSYQTPERRWPLMLLLGLMIIIALFLAADRWQDGALLRKMQALPWLQKTNDIGHAATPSTARGEAPAPLPAPVK